MSTQQPPAIDSVFLVLGPLFCASTIDQEEIILETIILLNSYTTIEQNHI